MNKKYELTDESIICNGRKLYRIRALKDFSDIKNGDLGGYVESEYNLSQEDNCWIYDNAKVYDDAEVSGKAEVFGNAEVYDNAEVFEDALVFGNAKINSHALVYGYAEVYSNALVCEDTEVYGHAEIYGNTQVYGHAEVYEDAIVSDNAKVSGHAQIYGNAIVNNYYKIIGKVIDRFDDILEIQNPKGRLVTAILRDGKIFYNIGCQNEISEEVFKYRIENEDGGLEKNPHRKYYYEIIDMVNYHFKNKIKEYTPED